MPVGIPSTAGDDAGGPPDAGLAARVAAGPGLWEDEDWLADLRRESLPESLLADGTITAAAAAEHAHKLAWVPRNSGVLEVAAGRVRR